MPESSRGNLFVVGGAEDKERGKLILRRFLDAAGADEARILVVATASSTSPRNFSPPTKTRSASWGHVTSACATRSSGPTPRIRTSSNRSVGPPGSTSPAATSFRLVTTLGGTTFASVLHDRYRSGLHIGGTSAGASAMSTVMIARGHGRSAPRLSSVRLSPGLGILRRVIVDQHFQERDRIGRLMAAVLRNPYMLGFGIDEDTAFIVSPGGRVEVLGRGTLTIVDGAELIGSNIADVKEHEPIAFAGIKVHVVGTGWEFDILARGVTVPQSPSPRAGLGESDPGDIAFRHDPRRRHEMKLLTIRALRGPNIYHHKPCILMKVDLEEMEEQPSDTLPDFRARLEAIIPSLHEHRCSVGTRGGSFPASMKARGWVTSWSTWPSSFSASPRWRSATAAPARRRRRASTTSSTGTSRSDPASTPASRRSP